MKQIQAEKACVSFNPPLWQILNPVGQLLLPGWSKDYTFLNLYWLLV